VAVVVYPAVALVRASFGRYSITGLYQGSVGTRNYSRLLEQEALPGSW
jgi:multiple sugar transport system permease protein